MSRAIHFISSWTTDRWEPVWLSADNSRKQDKGSTLKVGKAGHAGEFAWMRFLSCGSSALSGLSRAGGGVQTSRGCTCLKSAVLSSRAVPTTLRVPNRWNLSPRVPWTALVVSPSGRGLQAAKPTARGTSRTNFVVICPVKPFFLPSSLKDCFYLYMGERRDLYRIIGLWSTTLHTEASLYGIYLV